MFSLESVKKEVSNFAISAKHGLAVVDKTGNITLNGSHVAGNFSFSTNPFLFFLSDLLVIQDENTVCQVISLSDSERTIKDFNLTPNGEAIISSSFLGKAEKFLLWRFDGIERSLYLVDLNSLTEEKFINGNLQAFCLEDGIIFLDKKAGIISCVNLTGGEAWKSSLNESTHDLFGEETIIEWKKVLGVCDNLLFVSLSTGEIVSLDVLSGKLVDRYSNRKVTTGLDIFNLDGPFLPLGSSAFLDCYNKQIYSFHKENMLQLRFDNKEITGGYSKVEKSIHCDVEIERSRGVHSFDHNFIFVSNWMKGLIYVIGNDKKIIGYLDLNNSPNNQESSIQINKILYQSPHLYVFTNDGILQVFQIIQ